METEECKHCEATIIKLDNGLWICTHRIPSDLSKYCWVDPADGSQLHEPVRREYRKILNNIAEHWKVLDPDGKLVIVVDTESEANSLLSHLNRD